MEPKWWILLNPVESTVYVESSKAPQIEQNPPVNFL